MLEWRLLGGGCEVRWCFMYSEGHALVRLRTEQAVEVRWRRAMCHVWDIAIDMQCLAALAKDKSSKRVRM